MDIESSRKYGKNDANLLLTFVVCDIYKAILNSQKLANQSNFRYYIEFYKTFEDFEIQC